MRCEVIRLDRKDILLLYLWYIFIYKKLIERIIILLLLEVLGVFGENGFFTLHNLGVLPWILSSSKSTKFLDLDCVGTLFLLVLIGFFKNEDGILLFLLFVLLLHTLNTALRVRVRVREIVFLMNWSGVLPKGKWREFQVIFWACKVLLYGKC